MQIVNKKIGELIPYKNNPRIDKDAVKEVAASIKEFGFKVPIVIDKNNVIVAGHTRLHASKKLGLDEVPCIVADDLSDEQIKAFRLADNKVGELAVWDESLLSIELEELAGIGFDMNDFGFDFSLFEDEPEVINSGGSHERPQAADDSQERQKPKETEGPAYYGEERERTAEAYRLWEFDAARAAGKYQMPTLQAETHIPESLMGFNYVLSSDSFEKGVHFYLDDYQFERLWRSPERYLERLAKFDCCLTPDFSLYMNMPVAMKIWNIYRSRLLGQMMQDYGIITIPTLSWAGSDSFEYCFDGIEKGSVVSVSTIGVKRDSDALQAWKNGMDEALKRIKPRAVLVYGGEVDYDFKDVDVHYYQNEVQERWKACN